MSAIKKVEGYIKQGNNESFITKSNNAYLQAIAYGVLEILRILEKIEAKK